MTGWQKVSQGGALLYLDLDNFKLVNDTLGHQAGDKVLLDVAAMLQDAAGKQDMSARLGGDEFVIWLDNADRDAARGTAENLLKAADILSQYALNEPRALGLSIGIACIDSKPKAPSHNAESLIAHADEAMYEIKHGGKNAYAFAKGLETSGDRSDGY